MDKLTATLVKSTDSQKFYKLSRKIIKGLKTSIIPGFDKVIDLIEEQLLELEKVKEEFKSKYPLDGFEYICISDAKSHKERLVFGAWKSGDGESEVSRSHIQVAGRHTFLSYGGDESTFKSVEEYLYDLDLIN